MLNGGNLNFIDLVNLADFILQITTIGSEDRVHHHLDLQDEELKEIKRLIEGKNNGDSKNI